MSPQGKQKIEKKKQRQLYWCKRNFPIGTLVNYRSLLWTSFTTSLEPIMTPGLVIDYDYVKAGGELKLLLLVAGKVLRVSPGRAKTLQRPFNKPR